MDAKMTDGYNRARKPKPSISDGVTRKCDLSPKGSREVGTDNQGWTSERAVRMEDGNGSGRGMEERKGGEGGG